MSAGLERRAVSPERVVLMALLVIVASVGLVGSGC